MRETEIDNIDTKECTNCAKLSAAWNTEKKAWVCRECAWIQYPSNAQGIMNVENYKKQIEHLDNQVSELESIFQTEIIELQTLFLQEQARHAKFQGRYYHPKEQVDLWVEANDHLANPEIWRDEIAKKRNRLDKIKRLMDHVFGGKI